MVKCTVIFIAAVCVLLAVYPARAESSASEAQAGKKLVFKQQSSSAATGGSKGEADFVWGDIANEVKCANEEITKMKMHHEESVGRFTIVMGTCCLAITYILGYLLESFHITWFPEAGAGILVGIFAGFVVSLSSSTVTIAELIRFDPDWFFKYLLPPIIFEAGFNMEREPFFRNIGAICLYAFAGTTISCFVVAGFVYFAGKAGIGYELSGLASLVFGSLISATDPVTVLAVFTKLRVDIDLYSYVFGESVMNDAVAIVLYRSVLTFKCTPVSAVSIILAIINFCVIFIISTLIGLGFALLSSIIFKHAHMYQEEDEFKFLEIALLACFPYLSFMFAEGLRMSGIVAILFCGIAMSHYTWCNLSNHGKQVSRVLFKIFALLAETFVFVYLGLAVFTFRQELDGKLIVCIIVSMIGCLAGRALNIFPLTLIINRFRSATSIPPAITPKVQFLVWFSGLRGAVAFVIAVTSALHGEIPGADAILTITLVIAVVTIFAMGGPMAALVNKFDMRQKTKIIPSIPVVLTHRPPSRNVLQLFVWYDRTHLKPFFTRTSYDNETAKSVHHGAPMGVPGPDVVVTTANLGHGVVTLPTHTSSPGKSVETAPAPLITVELHADDKGKQKAVEEDVM